MSYPHKRTRAIAARLPGVRAFVAEVAEKRGATARTLLAQHYRTGDHRIVVKHRTGRKGLDSEIYLTGSAPGALELGHVDRNGKFVQGIHVLSRATGG